MESPTPSKKHKLALALLAMLLALGLAWRLIALRPAPEVRATVPDFPGPVTDREPITPLPESLALDPRKVALGELLFHDTRLSGDNTLSCASCHRLDKAGVDRQPHATGIGGARGKINAPTVFNSAFNFRQFWDGRAASLEEQAAGPIHNPIEMGSAWPAVIEKLSRDRDLLNRFAAVYPGNLQGRHIQDALAAFERSLITPSRFDRFLRGERNVLDAREQAGYRMFKDYGCTACHQGMNVGGNMYQSFGIFGNFFRDRGKDAPEDQGRYNSTHREEDRHRFKVPSLRNVALTAPYFHDGSVARLDDAVRVMGRYQIGRVLDDSEVANIVAFLTSLNGTYRGRPL